MNSGLVIALTIDILTVIFLYSLSTPLLKKINLTSSTTNKFLTAITLYILLGLLATLFILIGIGDATNLSKEDFLNVPKIFISWPMSLLLYILVLAD